MKMIVSVRDKMEKAETPLQVSILAHSEGNYMLMKGMEALDKALCAGEKANPKPEWVQNWKEIDQVLMTAADISAASFHHTPPDREEPPAQAIAKRCERVTVYYSGADEVLLVSNYEYYEYHLRPFPTRLGLIGPYGYPTGTETPKVIGVDCANVTRKHNGLSQALDVHSAYGSHPRLLEDMALTLSGGLTESLLRNRFADTSHAWYWLIPRDREIVDHNSLFKSVE